MIDELLAENDIETASKTLARLQEHIGGPYVRLRAVRLATKTHDADTAQTQFRLMCSDAEAPYLLLSKAVEAMTEAGWGPAADHVLGEAIEDDESVIHVGRLWVERHALRSDSPFEMKLPGLIARGAIGREALFAAIDALAKPMSADRLHHCISQHGDLLRETDRGWAKVGQALVDIRDYKVAAAWMADWRERDVAEPWMLLSAVISFRMLDRMTEAYDVSYKALPLPADETTSDHQTYVALEDALNGRTAAAQSLLSEIEADELDDVPRLFFALAESLVAVQSAAPSARATSFRNAKLKVEDAIASYAPRDADPDLARTYRRWTDRLARDGKTITTQLWGLWKRFRPSL